MQECFSRFLNCTNGSKLLKALHKWLRLKLHQPERARPTLIMGSIEIL